MMNAKVSMGSLARGSREAGRGGAHRSQPHQWSRYCLKVALLTLTLLSVTEAKERGQSAQTKQNRTVYIRTTISHSLCT